MTEKFIIQLVGELAPFNNAYRKAVDNNMNGNYVLKILWDAGDVICSKKIEHVHNIAWKIYGRSGTKRYSYLTRDFIAYCWRVRRYFKKREDIDEDFPVLKTHKAFKEALPLLTNSKYGLSKEEKKEVYRILNDEKLKATEIFDHLTILKRQKLPIFNPRTQRLHELKEIRKIFETAFARIENSELAVTKQQAEYISMLWLALLKEGRNFSDTQPHVIKNIGSPWQEIIRISLDLLKKKTVEDRNRFRRVIKPKELLRASAYLNKIFI